MLCTRGAPFTVVFFNFFLRKILQVPLHFVLELPLDPSAFFKGPQAFERRIWAKAARCCVAALCHSKAGVVLGCFDDSLGSIFLQNKWFSWSFS